MKKLYLVFLMLLILFIPGTHAVAVYQLDQPISELNGYTLREVFEENYITSENYFSINETEEFVQVVDINILSNHKYYIKTEMTLYSGYVQNFTIQSIPQTYLHIMGANDTYILENDESTIMRTYWYNSINLSAGYLWSYIDLTVLGLFNLTVEQMDVYYNLYLEAVRFENENIEASQDPGGYQNIFKSIINGVKTLINEMGYVWQFLNAPIITSDMSDYSFSIDWSWDLIGVIRQLVNSIGVLILQTNFIFINALLSFTGIPIQISILSLLFSNFVFVVLGWIIVKSFII